MKSKKSYQEIKKEEEQLVIDVREGLRQLQRLDWEAGVALDMPYELKEHNSERLAKLRINLSTYLF